VQTTDEEITTEKPCVSRFFGFVTRKRKGRRRKLKTSSENSAAPGEFFYARRTELMNMTM
jgi:hypothetical protein